MSLSVAAVPPIGSSFDRHTPLDAYQNPQKSGQSHPDAAAPAPARLSPYQQVETLKETGKSVEQIATALGLTAAQVDAALGIEPATTATVIPQGISVTV